MALRKLLEITPDVHYFHPLFITYAMTVSGVLTVCQAVYEELRRRQYVFYPLLPKGHLGAGTGNTLYCRRRGGQINGFRALEHRNRASYGTLEEGKNYQELRWMRYKLQKELKRPVNIRVG